MKELWLLGTLKTIWVNLDDDAERDSAEIVKLAKEVEYTTMLCSQDAELLQ